MRTRREGTLALGRAISLIAVAWCAISACGGTVEKSNRDGELGGNGGSGEVPPVGGVSGNGGGTVAVGGVSGVGGSLGAGGPGGSSGAGTGGMGSGGSIACGRAFCRPAQVPPSIPPFPACCPQPGPADPPGSSCGIDVSAFGILGYRFEPSCQRLSQPGSPDPVCPDTELFSQGTSPSRQEGCCRTDVGVCGYQLDVVGGVEMNLGCVSAAPFTSTRPIPCGTSSRPNLVSCTCANGSLPEEFCLAVDCGTIAVPPDVCTAACAELGGLIGLSCESASALCQ